MYNIGYNCQNAPTTDNFVNYFNRPDVQKAIHAPKIRYEACNAELIQGLTEELVAPPAYHIMPAIIEQGIPIHIYSGGRDFLFNHIGTELVIQNMTW